VFVELFYTHLPTYL